MATSVSIRYLIDENGILRDIHNLSYLLARLVLQHSTQVVTMLARYCLTQTLSVDRHIMRMGTLIPIALIPYVDSSVAMSTARSHVHILPLKDQCDTHCKYKLQKGHPE